MSFRVSCHCGAIKSEISGEQPTKAMSCNCSICRRKGSLMHFIATDAFSLETSRAAIGVYTFRTHNIKHEFCRTCGCAPFGEGTAPDGKAMVAINLRCAEEVDLSKLEIIEFDGASV